MGQSDIVTLLTAAEQIADGVAEMMNHVYNLDDRTKEALAAAVKLSCVISDELKAAEARDAL